MGGLSEPSEVVAFTSGIQDVLGQQEEVRTAIYTIDGKRVSQLQHGLNIVRQSNGEVRKIIVR